MLKHREPNKTFSKARLVAESIQLANPNEIEIN